MKRILAVAGSVALVAGGIAVAALASGNNGYPVPTTITTGTTGTVTTPTVPTTTTTSTVPTGHDCTFTGAGKDGQPGNDDCAPKTTTTVVVEHGMAQLVCPPGQPVVQTVTVTRTVQSKPQVVTKVVNHVKTRTVYRTKVIVKVKKVYVPGVHKNGVEGSG